MLSRAPDPTRVVALLQQLQSRFGSQELGQIMQILLALSFKDEGYTVIKNTVGVPDLQAFRPETPPGFALEAKTGGLSIAVSRRDLDGVLTTGRTPVVAFYFLSDPRARWWLIAASSLRATTYRRYEIQSKPRVAVDFDITDRFSKVVLARHAVAMEGPTPLARLLAN
jgi:hypothetical protein